MSPHSPIAPESHTRVAPPSQPPESHGRTDGRTDEDPHNVGDILAVSNVRGGVERFPVVRFGQRDEIPRDLRRAVYRRDGWRCKFCGRHASEISEGFELDHIIPWSAGGSDRSDNLRSLCGWHNEERSNYRLNGDDARVLPVTWWCIDCHGVDAPYRKRPADVRPAPRRIPTDATDLTFAYCATCDINSYTEVVL